MELWQNTDSWNRFYKAVEESQRIVFFGGAGVSTESGIPDFRSARGIYQHMPEEILSHDFFFQQPEIFYSFYKKYLLFENIQPSITHMKLAEWEKVGKLCSVITQNIDGLHQMAGNQKIWELHGSMQRNFCVRCSKFYSMEDLLDLLKDAQVPLCSCGGMIKPDVVLYGESLNDSVIEGAVRDLARADLCIVGGTSLSVYPAAGLLRHFTDKERLFLINREDLSDKISNLHGGVFFLAGLGDVFQKLP